jgi:hypothetical protein
MKSIITLTAITILAVAALVGCNQNTSSNLTDISTTNSNMSGASGTIGGNTNMSAINSVPDIKTNMPQTNSLPEMNTNMPASTNQ